VLAGYNPTPAEEFERDSNGEVVVTSRQPSTPAPKKRAESPNKGVVISQPTSDMEDLIICPLHGYDADGAIVLVKGQQVEFFKRGRMKNHAHPMEDIDGSSKWCNRYDVVKLIETGAINTPITVPPVPAPEPEPEPEPEPVPTVVEAEVIETGDDTGNDDEVPYRGLAETSGYTWEEFVEQVLPTDSLADYLSMGGSLKGLTARLKRLQEK